ncbi:MAG: YihA family ribosome biogenesis GTP-binding protein [Gammaproteobacteria bacterium]|nr:YihA family ribosome biogenesis GTP-binding protein [Gammaproteobacteria bacterium]MYD77087.1 YihA family ribosome biogenesis GTP-binding protein [Gammaproteobacteria bacterium]MYJ51481.1 YihA family ribosome biogenesis GTP-binding protein [Gammaproteobacteria bacterium]
MRDRANDSNTPCNLGVRETIIKARIISPLSGTELNLSTPAFSQIQFELAASRRSQWPQGSHAEIAFAGRSNVGKSSAINAITGRQNLARTSKTPGRTQQIVFFRLAEGRYLVDLPGYGYAKAPINLRRHWETFITDYLYNRPSLRALCIPMDIRHPLTSLDRTMLACCRDVGLHAHVLLTKADKFKRGRATTVYREVCRDLANEPAATAQLFSARSGIGVDEARETVSGFLSGTEPPGPQ